MISRLSTIIDYGRGPGNKIVEFKWNLFQILNKYRRDYFFKGAYKTEAVDFIREFEINNDQ